MRLQTLRAQPQTAPNSFQPAARPCLEENGAGRALSVSQPSDSAEREADRAAAQAFRATESSTQRRPSPNEQSVASNNNFPTIVRDVLASPGEPLEQTSRNFFEPRFGHNFGHVRVHADAKAAGSARELHAHAYAAGRHLVFAEGRLAPETPAGRSLLAHELAHTLQAAIGIARQPNDEPSRLFPGSEKALEHKLPERKPNAPQPRSTDLPLGPTPCLTGEICKPPVRGSAWDFGKEAGAGETHPVAPVKATALKQAANKFSPGILKDIFEVTVNPSIDKKVGAQVSDCSTFNVATPDRSAKCIEVPDKLERQAARYNQGAESPDADVEGGDTRGGLLSLGREFWEKGVRELLTHEVAHVTFGRNKPVEISSATTNEITHHELSEIFAQMSEFPPHYRFAENSFAVLEPAERFTRLVGSVRAWVGTHVEQDGEGFRGMVTKLRCINTCDKTQTVLRSVTEAATRGWRDAERTAFLSELTDPRYRLDWPALPPSLKPAEEPHPKATPLYQPRAGVPEVGEVKKKVE